jgi:polynucleotide 5'-hydroxyl-kinase GRC3/NOL9
VLSGEITIAGAAVRPESHLFLVHAALCHSLPVIRSSGRAKIELHHNNKSINLRLLDRLSPLFRGLWNQDSGSAARENVEVLKSFQIVCGTTKSLEILPLMEKIDIYT